MAWDREIHIKTPAEIELMREAGRVNAQALAGSVRFHNRVLPPQT